MHSERCQPCSAAERRAHLRNPSMPLLVTLRTRNSATATVQGLIPNFSKMPQECLSLRKRRWIHGASSTPTSWHRQLSGPPLQHSKMSLAWLCAPGAAIHKCGEMRSPQLSYLHLPAPHTIACAMLGCKGMIYPGVEDCLCTQAERCRLILAREESMPPVAAGEDGGPEPVPAELAQRVAAVEVQGNFMFDPVRSLCAVCCCRG